MNRANNARSKGLPVIGNVFESFQNLTNLIPINDGSGSFIQLSSEAYAQDLPLYSENTETTINITTTDHNISQINDSFLIVNGTMTIRIPEINATALIDDPYLFFGHKSSNKIFRQMRILHNGKNTEYLSTESLREGFGFGVYKDTNEKKAKKHTHTLYEDIAAYNPGICGTYVKLSNFKNTNKTAVIPFRYIVPLSDLLPLQAFSLYPSEICGALSLRLNFTLRGLVFCQVPPVAVKESTEFLTGIRKTIISSLFEIPFDHKFTQIGDAARIIDIDLNGDDYETRTVTPILDGFSITRLSCQHMGYGVKPETMNAIKNMLENQPILIPAQQMEFVKYASALAGHSSSYSASVSHVFTNAESISVVFPTTANQFTAFRNPMINNFQLKIDGKLYPAIRMSTNTDNSPEFLTFQLNASDLDGAISPTTSLMYSLTENRHDSTGNRYAYSRFDNSDFILTMSTERSQGGNVFDGLNTSGPVTVELRFDPLFTGGNNVYYYDDFGNINTQAPELWICKDTFFIIGVNKVNYVDNVAPK